MNGTNRRLPIIAAAVLGAAVVALTAAVVTQRLAAAGVSRDAREQKALLTRYERELRDCSAYEKDYRDCSLKLGGRWAECSWSDQAPFMIVQLAVIVEQRGLKMDSFQPQPMSSAKGILRFPVRISLQGGLASLAGVLAEIEKTIPLLEIERLDIRRAPDKGDNLQVDMMVSSFVVIDENAPVAKRRAAPKVAKPADTSMAKPAASAAPPPTSAAKRESLLPPRQGPAPRLGAIPPRSGPASSPPAGVSPSVKPAEPPSAVAPHVAPPAVPSPRPIAVGAEPVRRDSNGGPK